MDSKIKLLLVQKLSATNVVVKDFTEQHLHHPEAQKSKGGHFELKVVSNKFAGQSPLQRHRMVYAALEELMQDIHALTISAHTPSEIQS